MKEKVNVTGVPETMIQTLYARAKETKKQNAKINLTGDVFETIEISC